MIGRLSRRAVRRAAAVLGVGALALSASGVASASSVSGSVVDTTAPTGEVTLVAGDSAAIQINLSVTGNQAGTATFKVNKDWTLSGGAFTGTNAHTFTVGPRDGGDAATVLSTTGTVSVAQGEAAGAKALQLAVFDITNSNTSGGKLEAGAFATYSVKVVGPSDTTPPVITPNVSGTLGSNGWYTSDVSVSWSVTDSESTVTSTTGCTATTVSNDTAGTTLTCSATSSGGTATKSVTVKKDATNPTLTATPSVAANGAGYNNTAVSVEYSCSDATSGLASTCPATDTASTDGTHTFAHKIADQAGNEASVRTTVKIDATKPTIVASRTDSNGAGWNNGSVVVTFKCTDSGTAASGIKSCVADGTNSNEKTVTAEGANQSVSGTATDNADNTNTATVSGINIDTTAPVIALTGQTPANDDLWNNGNVVLTWSCQDVGGSGVVSETVTQTLSLNGAGQSATGTCEDKAGNPASHTVTGINIDKTPPVIAFTDQAPAANAAGWNNSDVTVTWSCSDTVSGPVNHAVALAVSTEGADQSLTGTCADLAGNTASDTKGGINLDRTGPQVTYTSASPAANAAGWNNSDVTATFTATDALSGFSSGSKTATADVTTSGEGASVSVSSPAFTDVAGNTVAAGAASASFKVDKTAPTDVAFAGGPAEGARYYSSTVPTAPTCTASDALSGVASCTVSGYSTTEGTHTLTATAKDVAGNESTAVRSYTVRNLTRTGFFAPVDMDKTNTIKGGNTVPLKFEVFDGQTERTDTAVVKSFSASKVSCSTGVAEDAIELFTTTGQTELRYDTTAGQFIQNWKTPTGSGCYKATLTTVDGQTIVANFKTMK